MQPAAHADAELMDNFPSFPLPPPPVPQHGRSSLAHGGASPGPAVGCSAAGGAVPAATGAGGHRGCPHGWHRFPGRAGGRAAPPRGTASPAGVSAFLPRGQRIPSSPSRDAQHPSRGSHPPFAGASRGCSCPSHPNVPQPPGTPPPPPLTRVICLQGARRQLSLRGCRLVIKQFSLLIFQA